MLRGARSADSARSLGEGPGSWFAVYVKHHAERLAASLLRARGYEAFLPLRRFSAKWADRVREKETPLFSRYVFCRFNPTDRGLVASTPGVIHVLGDGSRPIPIEPSEISALQRIVASPQPFNSCPFLSAGQQVSFHSGPLRGLNGFLISAGDHCKVVVSIVLMQRSVAVQVPHEWVTPLHSACLRVAS